MFDNFRKENLFDLDQIKDLLARVSREEKIEKNKKWLVLSLVTLVGVGVGIFAWFKFFKEDEYDLDEYEEFDDDFDDDFEEDYFTEDEDDEDDEDDEELEECCDCGDDCTCSDEKETEE